MRVLHFDCFSGISGDMAVAALVSAGAPQAAIEAGVASLGLPIRLTFANTQRGALAAKQFTVAADDQQPHRYLREIQALLQAGKLTDAQRALALRIFELLARAEAKVHGIDVNEVHFHEVGALDSIADVVAAAIAIDCLAIQHVTARPAPTGSGTVKTAHGLLPIPAPATADLLIGAPLAPSNIKCELTTPTGAAILAALVKEWTETPRMRIDQIGYGAGQKDFPQQPNVLRVFVGEATAPGDEGDVIWEVQTNLDDVAPEIIGYCLERLLAGGAIDAFTQPIQMKKGRPGILLTALVPEPARAAVEEVIFLETGTFGLRRREVQRSKLRRESRTVSTKWGPVLAKLGWQEGRPPILTPEYEDCARLARQTGIPLRHIYEEVQRAWQQEALPTEPR
jgi:uncharacterized protein (TIGR00299 family) protein